MLFIDFYHDIFLPHKRLMKVSDYTIQSYQYRHKDILDTFQNYNIEEIDKKTIHRVLIKWEKEDYTDSQIYDRNKNINLIMAVSVELGYNEIWKPIHLKKPKPEIKIFTKDELQILLKYKNTKYYVAWLIGITGGLRRGELCGLKGTDYKNGSLSITRSVVPIPGEGKRVKSPKTESSVRTIALPEFACKYLEKYIAKMDNPSNYLLTDRPSPLSPDTLSRRFSEYVADCGLEPRHLHCLRHTHASLLISEGVDVVAVAARLGQNKMTTLKYYAHYISGSDSKTARLLDDFFK